MLLICDKCPLSPVRPADSLQPVGVPLIDRDSIANDSALPELRDRLRELQLAQIAHNRRAIILFEGPQGSGKKAALSELAAAFDPCHFAVNRSSFDRREAAHGHWLARFWGELPGAGDTAIFFRSWYRHVLDDRLLGRINEEGVPRAYDEINEFEAQQRDYGTLIVKLYFDVSAEVQQQRLDKRAADPWRQLRREEPVWVGDPAYVKAFADLKANSDTRWSPWKIIDANDERQATMSALGAIAEAWAKAMPAEPPHLVESRVA